MVRRVANSEEHHKEQFRGTWIASRVWRMFWSKKLTMKEMVLLAAIDVLSSDEDGCCASNEYFAGHLSITPNGVGNMITKLVKMGCLERAIKRTQKGTKRYLSVVYNARTPLVDGVRTPSRHGVHSPPSEGNVYSIGGDDSFCGGQTMPFMKEFEKEEVEDTHHQRAARLIGGLKKARRLTGPSSARKWAIHFKRLHKDLNQDDARLDKALTWYLENIKDQYTPRVHSAASFREKFIRIEDAMARATESEVPVLEITDQAKRVAGVIQMRRWEKGSAKDLPYAVQASITNYEEFHARLYKFETEILPSLDLAKVTTMQSWERSAFANFVTRTRLRLPSASTHTEYWFKDLHDRVYGWEGWSGDLTKHIFKVDSKQFKQYGHTLTADSGTTNLWDTMMELLYANPET